MNHKRFLMEAFLDTPGGGRESTAERCFVPNEAMAFCKPQDLAANAARHGVKAFPSRDGVALTGLMGAIREVLDDSGVIPTQCQFTPSFDRESPAGEDDYGPS